MQDIALVIKGVEQVPQLMQIVRFCGLEQVGFAGDHIIRTLRLTAQGLVGHLHGSTHQHIHLRPVRVHGVQQAIADAVQIAAAIGVIDIVGGLAQFCFVVVPIGMNDAVLHLGAVDHQHHQHPLAR